MTFSSLTSELWTNCLPFLTNPVNLALLLILGYSIYPLLPTFKFDDLNPLEDDAETLEGVKIARDPSAYNWQPAKLPQALVWRTYTPLELRSFDGTDGEKIVYDVTPGRNFYGPDGPYGNFAGRDASRGLAKQTFEQSALTPVDGPIDDLNDLTDTELHDLREWEVHFKANELIENSDRASRPL